MAANPFCGIDGLQARPSVVTVACHEDLSATDLVGRYLLEGDEPIWHDASFTTAVRTGICYLDEVVEARKDTIVLIHPLTDDRRILPVEKRGELLPLPILSCGDLLQSRLPKRVLKACKQSTRQPILSMGFITAAEAEVQIVAR